ncbi:unnamed protein product [Ilex paraguariensis]|uniref:Uncharacterized protein n=1 Tax=Ilex paraguariensis TaxID=185542 RepID=A0ABC8TFA4_9AQUA
MQDSNMVQGNKIGNDDDALSTKVVDIVENQQSIALKSKRTKRQRDGAQRASPGKRNFEKSKVHSAIGETKGGQEGSAHRAIDDASGCMGSAYGTEATTNVGWNRSEPSYGVRFRRRQKWRGQ